MSNFDKMLDEIFGSEKEDKTKNHNIQKQEQYNNDNTSSSQPYQNFDILLDQAIQNAENSARKETKNYITFEKFKEKLDERKKYR